MLFYLLNYVSIIVGIAPHLFLTYLIEDSLLLSCELSSALILLNIIPQVLPWGQCYAIMVYRVIFISPLFLSPTLYEYNCRRLLSDQYYSYAIASNLFATILGN